MRGRLLAKVLAHPLANLPRPLSERELGTRRFTPMRLVLLAGAIVILVGAGLVVYTIVATLLWQSARRTEARRTDLERQISIVAPDAEQLQADSAQWQRLEPAFEKDWFPVVQLSRITAAMPVSGVVLREFRTTDRTIRLRGQARDVQLANRLVEDLRALDEFKRYEWSMPNPKVEKNNTATFEIEGKPKNASPES